MPFDLTIEPPIQIVVELAVAPAPMGVSITPPPFLVVELAVAQGPAGPAGVSGAIGGSYLHTQSAAAALWTVNHNLGYRPAVSPLSVGGVEMSAEVIHASVNQALVYFDAATAGLAVCS